MQQARPADAEPVPANILFDHAVAIDQIARLAYARSGERLLSKQEVRNRTGLGDTEIWRRLNAGAFPQPRLRSASRLCWLESELTAWMHSLPVSSGFESPNKAPPVRHPGRVP